MLYEFGIILSHEFGKHVDHAVQERFFKAEHLAVAGSAPDNAAQHIPPARVFRQHTIGEEKTRGANVIRNDPHRHVVFVVVAIGFADEFFHRRDDGAEEVGIINALYALQNPRNAFETHTRIDALLGQRGQVATGIAVVLHEHEIPDFQEAVACAAKDVFRACA